MGRRHFHFECYMFRFQCNFSNFAVTSASLFRVIFIIRLLLAACHHHNILGDGGSQVLGETRLSYSSEICDDSSETGGGQAENF